MPNNVYEARRANLARLLAEAGAKVDLAARLGMTQPQISHWLRDPATSSARKITEDSARAIEVALRLPAGDLDKPGKGKPVNIFELPPAPPRQPSTPRPPPPKPAAAAVSKAIDTELLTETTRAVLLEVGKIRGPQLAEKVADVVTLAFAHATDHGELDTGYVHQLVKLMH